MDNKQIVPDHNERSAGTAFLAHHAIVGLFVHVPLIPWIILAVGGTANFVGILSYREHQEITIILYKAIKIPDSVFLTMTLLIKHK